MIFRSRPRSGSFTGIAAAPAPKVIRGSAISGFEDVEEEIVTLADRLREEGRQKGRVEGEQKGARHDRRGVVLKLLTLRFGKLPEAAVARVNAAEMDQLDV